MLKESINQEFITAFKNKNTFRKDTLGLLKAKITEAEKKENTILTDNEIYTVIASLIKQREQAIEVYSKNDSEQAKLNAINEGNEIIILKEFLPEQMSDEEMRNLVIKLSLESYVSSVPLLSIVMKEFNAKYKGRFDNKKLRQIVEEITKI